MFLLQPMITQSNHFIRHFYFIVFAALKFCTLLSLHETIFTPVLFLLQPIITQSHHFIRAVLWFYSFPRGIFCKYINSFIIAVAQVGWLG